MEKDSFENQLRNKVMQAESSLDRGASKERVWDAVQTKPRTNKKIYYAAAVFFIIAMASVLYVKNDKLMDGTAKIKTKEPPKSYVAETKPLLLQQDVVVKQNETMRKAKAQSQKISVNTIDTAQSNDPLPKPVITNEIAKVNEAVEVKITSNGEIKIAPVIVSAPVPEFSVQFKRGKPTVDTEKQAKEAIARLKKFKLGKDTSVFANFSEKQKEVFKIKF